MKPKFDKAKRRSPGFSLSSLTDDELYAIHLATLEVLEQTGLFVETREALDVFDGAGAEIDRKNKIVKIPPYLVDDAIRSAPAKIIMAGRDPKNDKVLETDRVHFTNFSEGVEIVDPYTAERRTPSKADLANAAKVVDYLSDIDVCEKAAQGEVFTAVNFNSPGQVVIAGNTDAVERAVILAKEAGAKRALILPVSVPSHCSLMNPAAEQLEERLAGIDINKPSIPVYNNVDVQAESEPNAIRDALKRQLYSPVRWVDTINTITKQDVQHIVECGPGKVLVGLNKRINKQMTALSTLDVDNLKKAIESVQTEG